MEAVGQKAAARDGKGVGRQTAGVREIAGECVTGIEGKSLTPRRESSAVALL